MYQVFFICNSTAIYHVHNNGFTMTGASYRCCSHIPIAPGGSAEREQLGQGVTLPFPSYAQVVMCSLTEQGTMFGDGVTWAANAPAIVDLRTQLVPTRAHLIRGSKPAISNKPAMILAFKALRAWPYTHCSLSVMWSMAPKS
jgi:hypothetical protein